MVGLLTFIAGAVIGALSSWFITHRYYLKANADQRAELQRLSENLRPKNTLADFERYLDTSSWTKESINHTEVWVCNADSTFLIEQGERSREFKERWTTVYPDQNSSAYPVYLKIAGTVIKKLMFISMDGRRIFVPMAEVRPAPNNTVEYFWNINSLEVKVCRVIGDYYIYKDLEGVAKVSKVTLVQ
jgi:hypothetical protein